MRPAIIYARYSPRPGGAGDKDTDEHTIEKQFQRCRAYCEACRFEVCHEIADMNVSGKLSVEERPNLGRAIEEACQSRGVLVVYDLDRLARKLSVALSVLETLRGCKADIAMVARRLDTTTPMGEAMFQIVGVFAELMRKENAIRTSRAMIYHQANGKLMSRHPPFGWRHAPTDRKKLIPDLREQKALDRMIALRQSGLSAGQICTQLRQEGYRPRSGSEFDRVLVWRTLKKLDISPLVDDQEEDGQ